MQGPKPAEHTIVELELRPSGRTIGGRNYSRFSYRYHYRSAAIPIYKILDRGSWEVGGSALGNEFWMRNCFVPSITRIESAAQFYSTERYQSQRSSYTRRMRAPRKPTFPERFHFRLS